MAYQSYGNVFRPHMTPWVKRLLIANVAVFLVGAAVGPDVVTRWFAFTPSELISRPWAVGTYMFVHLGFWHLLWNMVGLVFFGPALEDRWGSQEFIRFYLICGIGGIALSFFFSGASVAGASAAVYGVLLAFAMTWPDAPIHVWGILPVKAKWLVGFFAALSFFYAVTSQGGGVAHFAHLGGFVAAFAYMKRDVRPSKQKSTTQKARPRRLAIVPREPVARAAREEPRPRRDEDRELLDRVDAVLDKISAEGMGSLTDDERALLDEVSRRHRTN